MGYHTWGLIPSASQTYTRVNENPAGQWPERAGALSRRADDGRVRQIRNGTRPSRVLSKTRISVQHLSRICDGETRRMSRAPTSTRLVLGRPRSTQETPPAESMALRCGQDWWSAVNYMDEGTCFRGSRNLRHGTGHNDVVDDCVTLRVKRRN